MFIEKNNYLDINFLSQKLDNNILIYYIVSSEKILIFVMY